MNVLLQGMLPEILLCVVACVLFLIGVSKKPISRLIAAELALIALIAVFLMELFTHQDAQSATYDSAGTIRIHYFGHYIKLIAAGVGILLALLNFPTNEDNTGNSAAETGNDTAEYFGLMLLSIAGLLTVASCNDIILMFLGIELASIPTYIMVSISRPLPVAQEAGVKYFFLGAMSAAIMLFGFSYLYGTTGMTSLDAIGKMLPDFPGSTRTALSDWQMLAVLMLLGGFAFKMAAAPLHVYAGDVYQGAATPMTAFLAFVPKTTGFVALLKVLYAVGGNSWAVPEQIVKVLWVIAALTMTAGNVLGLLQFNVKRVLAYSSVAHTGYMLVGVTALVTALDPNTQSEAMKGVMFYLAAYGLMNVGIFGILMLLPSRTHKPATSAETFDDLAGQGRNHVVLGLAMAAACFSLTGLPLTIGFFGKIYLIQPALHAKLTGLVIVLVINAAISAGYYLRIVGAMFLRAEPNQTNTAKEGIADAVQRLLHPAPVVTAVAISVIGTIVFGTFIPATEALNNRAAEAALYESQVPSNVATNPTPPPAVSIAAK